MVVRHTSNKEVNKAIDPFVKQGWAIAWVGTNKQTQVLVPPAEVLALNPELPPHIPLHSSPSDRHAGHAKLRDIKRYKVPEQKETPRRRGHQLVAEERSKKKYFCRTCGPSGDEFDTELDRNVHENMHDQAKELLGTAEQDPFTEAPRAKRAGVPTGNKGRNYQCPQCAWCKDGRRFRLHIQKEHADFWSRVRGELLTMEGLEHANQVRWGDQIQVVEAPRLDEDTQRRLLGLAKVAEGLSEFIREVAK